MFADTLRAAALWHRGNTRHPGRHPDRGRGRQRRCRLQNTLAPVGTSHPSLIQLLRAQMFAPQQLGWDEAEAANRFPPHHQDPMDRMLIATTLMHKPVILTDDRIFASYAVKTIW